MLKIVGEYPLNWQLCLVKGNCAYFSKDKPSDVYGDDWNDAPYEHNAGEPYGFKFPYFKVYFSAGLIDQTYMQTNSRYSVNDLNDRDCKHYWLRTDPCNVYINRFSIEIYTGILFSAFVRLVELVGGEIMLPVIMEREDPPMT